MNTVVIIGNPISDSPLLTALQRLTASLTIVSVEESTPTLSECLNEISTLTPVELISNMLSPTYLSAPARVTGFVLKLFPETAPRDSAQRKRIDQFDFG